MDSTFSLAGKKILITGAASGISREFARHASADGADVGLLDINGEGLKETVGLLEGAGKVVTATVDLAIWRRSNRRSMRSSRASAGSTSSRISRVGRSWRDVEQPL